MLFMFIELYSYLYTKQYYLDATISTTLSFCREFLTLSLSQQSLTI